MYSKMADFKSSLLTEYRCSYESGVHWSGGFSDVLVATVAGDLVHMCSGVIASDAGASAIVLQIGLGALVTGEG